MLAVHQERSGQEVEVWRQAAEAESVTWWPRIERARVSLESTRSRGQETDRACIQPKPAGTRSNMHRATGTLGGWTKGNTLFVVPPLASVGAAPLENALACSHHRRGLLRPARFSHGPAQTHLSSQPARERDRTRKRQTDRHSLLRRLPVCRALLPSSSPHAPTLPL